MCFGLDVDFIVATHRVFWFRCRLHGRRLTECFGVNIDAIDFKVATELKCYLYRGAGDRDSRHARDCSVLFVCRGISNNHKNE